MVLFVVVPPEANTDEFPICFRHIVNTMLRLLLEITSAVLV